MAVAASDMVTAIKEALYARAAAGGVGVVSVTIDGTTTACNLDQAYKELSFWQKLEAQEAGTRRLVNTLDLRNI